MDVNYTFNLDNLPVHFGAKLLTLDNGLPSREPLNEAMKKLSEIIWKKGGFRFAHTKTKSQTSLVYEYHCAQDSQHEETPKSIGRRDVHRMERFHCKSKLRMRVSLESRIMSLTMYHIHHSPYTEVQLCPDVIRFLEPRISVSTPGEIFRDLMAANIPGSAMATQSQIYYQWQQANSRTWRRDQDQFTSAMCLLKEGHHQHREYISGNMRGLAVFIHDIIDVLASDIKELAMDATYGTNNAGMDLFAVLAELDGTGIPLAYCFIQTMPSEDGKCSATPGALTSILSQVLSYLKALRIQPSFFGTDKDRSEIAAVRQVWPHVSHQLCYCHVKRAIRSKLKDTNKTKTQTQYVPAEAQLLIPDLDICWGSIPTRRPDGYIDTNHANALHVVQRLMKQAGWSHLIPTSVILFSRYYAVTLIHIR